MKRMMATVAVLIMSIIPIQCTKTPEPAPETGIYRDHPYFMEETPFSPITKFDFELTDSSEVLIDLYNVIGEKIRNIMDSKLGKGKYTVEPVFDTLPSGVYFGRIRSISIAGGDTAVTIHKLILMR